MPPEKPREAGDPDLAGRTSSSCATGSSVEDEQKFEELWRRARPVGRLVDDLHDDRRARARRASQRAFLRNLARGEAYQAEAPTLWDVDFRTAVAQAELEDRELPGAYHAVRFHGADGGGDVVIETTRPELIPACVALVAHPDDERYQPLFGTEVRTPLFGVRGAGRSRTRSPIPRRAPASR